MTKTRGSIKGIWHFLAVETEFVVNIVKIQLLSYIQEYCALENSKSHAHAWADSWVSFESIISGRTVSQRA